MIDDLPTLLEVISYGLTAWALGFVGGWKITIFKQIMERIT
jgi:hypothetical protein